MNQANEHQQTRFGAGDAADDPAMLPDLSECTVLIPAAGRVAEGLLSFSSIATPAMIPVAGAPVIHWTLRYLTSLGARRFRIAVPKRGLSVEDYVAFAFGHCTEVDWMVPERDGGPGHTVASLLRGLDGPALIVLGDTLFEFASTEYPMDEPWLLVSSVEESARWCVIETDEEGRVSNWFDKTPGLSPPLTAAAGVYWIPDARDALSRAQADTENRSAFEISDVLGPQWRSRGAHAVEAGTWRDCGNPDTQEMSKRSILQERAFNRLDFNEDLGSIRKSSTNRAKLIDEISYLRLLPTELAAMFPRVISSSTSWDEPFVEMEYYGYPTLTELYLFEQMPGAIWQRIFHRLRSVLGRFADHHRPLSIDDVRSMYEFKTIQRLEQAKATPHLREALDRRRLTINGRDHLAIEEAARVAMSELLATKGQRSGSIIHGDFCFSNILYDVRTNVCKLIDPRGSFGNSGIYGDQRYDVAKLHHSVVGLYDHLVAGLFELKHESDEFELVIPTTNLQREATEAYARTILPHYPSREVGLITGLMFLGLPPLHPESSDRQLAFLIRGTQLIHDALEVPAT